MTRRVLLLIALHVVGGTLLVVANGYEELGSVEALVGFAAAFAVVGFVPLHLELRQNTHTITITEAVLVASVFHLPPAGVVLAAVCGEFVVCLVTRLRALRLAFNVAQTFGAAAVAALVFQAFGPVDATTPLGWTAALLAAVAFATTSMLTVTWVLTLVETTSFRRMVAVAATSVIITALASAALGLALLILTESAPLAPILLAPVVALVVLESKRVTDASAERLRFQRLYEASSRAARLSRLEEAVTVLASEARDLLTGAQAICCAQGEVGGWSGVVVDDEGSRPLDDDAVRELVAVTGNQTLELAWEDLGDALQRVCPDDSDLVVAPSDTANASQVILAVAAAQGGEKRQSGLAEVLSAFAGTAALAVNNAALYAEVEEALRHQIDLNRQKAEFVAAVSHELRTPLASILGSVQTIHRLGPRLAPDDAGQLLEAALGQGARLRRLIEDLLLVAAAEHRTAQYQPHPVDPAVLLGELQDQFRTATPEQRLNVSIDVGVGMLSTDEDKLQRVLTNLVENAVKYAPEGPIDLCCSPGEGATRFTVADRGPGIPAGERDRIFERFVQLDQSSTRRQGGTGLGLHLCRNVAELLGGTLSVRGRDDGASGAVFELTIPDPPAAPPDERDGADHEPYHLSTPRPT